MLTKAKRTAVVPAWHQPEMIARAIADLKTARNTLRDCGCSNAADYVARALKSAEGALRHARHFACNCHNGSAGCPVHDPAVP